MFQFAQIQHQSQKDTSTNPVKSWKEIFEPNRKVNNGALLSFEQGKPYITNANRNIKSATPIAHNFGQIPIYAKSKVKLQPKLTINKPGDAYEQEADNVANRVMHMHEPKLQRACACGGTCPKCKEEKSEHEQKQLQQRHTGSNNFKQVEAPGLVHEALQSAGHPLEPSTRAFMEPRFGHNFSHVRVHTDTKAAESAASINALAYTVGQNVVFGVGQYALQTSAGKRLLAHELAHVVQQDEVTNYSLNQPAVSTQEAQAMPQNRHIHLQNSLLHSSVPVLQRQPDAIQDAGVPLPGGVVDTSAPRRPVSELDDSDFGIEYEDAEQLALSGIPDRLIEIEEEIEKRLNGFGTAVPRGLSPGVPANTAVTPDVALKILDNVSKGEAPFKPELGKGGASWFVTEGNPHVGIDPTKNVNVEVEVPKGEKPITFQEADLAKLLEAESKGTAAEAEATFRRRFGLDETTPLNSRLRKSLARFQRLFAESRMWDRVGETVRSSAQKIGEVILEPGSKFSKTPGKFAVVADPAKIQLKGGPGPLLDTLTKAGVSVEPPILEAAEALAKKQKWAGRVRGVFRYGGRILIVVAVAADVYKIYRAQDKTKAVITSAGGWAGATAAGAAFAVWFTPADVAGPWAWAAHGVGTLVAGGVGYWVGSEVTRTIYELALE